MVEIKLAVASDKQQGLYQCCAYMAAAQSLHKLPVIYGVYSDFSNWTFLKLENDEITCTFQSSLFDFFKVQFGNGAFQIFSHLFEMFDIPVTVDVGASEVQLAQHFAEPVKELLSSLRSD